MNAFIRNVLPPTIEIVGYVGRFGSTNLFEELTGVISIANSRVCD